MCNWSSYLYGIGMLIDQIVSYKYEYGDCHILCIVSGDNWKQNTYIVVHKESRNTILIDPGGHHPFIIYQIERLGGKVTHIFLTHSHHDHVGAVPQLSEYYDIACELHQHDVRLLMQVTTYALKFANKRIEAITRFQSFEKLCLDYEKPSVRAFDTPGHTKGGVCYMLDGFVFTGDTLLNRCIGRTDLPGSNLPVLHASVTALLAEIPEDSIIFPGHGKPWIAREAKKWWADEQYHPSQHDQFNNI